MDRAGVAIEATDLPTKRAIFELYNGGLDFDFVSPVWFAGGNVGEQFVASDPILRITEYFVTLPENQRQYQDPSSPYGNVVGTISGYYYYDEALFQRMDFPSERHLVEGLRKRRFDVAILEQLTAEYWSRQLGLPLALASIHTQGDMEIPIPLSICSLSAASGTQVQGARMK